MAGIMTPKLSDVVDWLASQTTGCFQACIYGCL